METKKDKDGVARFFYRKKDVTALWMGFFSTLSAEEEKDCVKLFTKRYKKIIQPPKK